MRMRKTPPLLIMSLLNIFFGLGSLHSNEILFKTGFEVSEGYEPLYDLGGVNGWVATNAGGSGIPDDTFFEGQGQQAFIGFTAFDQISDANYSLFLWNPVDFIPTENENPILEFNVTFQILDSSNGHTDDFRWSFFNTENDRLFTIDFDNTTLRVNYLLGSSSDFIDPRTSFNNTNIYQLKVRMDYGENSWSCWLDGSPIIEDQIIFEDGVKRSLGDVSATWVVKDADNPGDNIMVFDNYEILKIQEVVQEPVLDVRIFRKESGSLMLSAKADIESQWIIQGSDDLIEWNFLTEVTLTPEGNEWLLNQGQQKGFWRLVPR